MRSILILFAIIVSQLTSAQVNLGYYLPKDVTYDTTVPTPEKVIGHQVGEWHVTHDKLYFYMVELARVSSRAVWEPYGKSHEGRPLGQLIITSPANHLRLEQIRKEHLMLSDPAASAGADVSKMPIIIKLGYGIHGNESSSQNASMLAAYYFIAAQGDEIDKILENTVILIDPSLNPDGLQRHSTWVNMHKSTNLNSDEQGREFSEVWPGGRTNHYWFDLNRDYIMLQHPESQGRIAAFHRWMPNINTDHHEMGASSTFFFQPGVPTRQNPHVPAKNQVLTTEIGKYHAKYLDEAGSLYYSEEDFDDFYMGKGSGYPDIHGSIGILFEQAGVKGHLRETSSGMISFPFAIKNQFLVSLSSVEAGMKMKETLMNYQREFYQSALKEADSFGVKAYVFTEPDDKARLALLIDNLQQHKIIVYKLGKTINRDGVEYKAGESYIVPLKQKEYRFIRSLFEPITKFEDDIFYDISTWVMPYAFNIQYAPVNSDKDMPGLVGAEVTDPIKLVGGTSGSADSYAYLFEWDNYFSPALLYKLMDAGISTRVATLPFAFNEGGQKKSFRAGTIMVHAYGQPLDKNSLYEFINESAAEFGVRVSAVKTGLTIEGIDLGSNDYVVLQKPGIAMFVEDGISSSDAGELWHLFDVRFRIPVTLIPSSRAGSVDLNRYNVIIVAGSPDMGDQALEKVKEWNRTGGTIIAYKGGVSWAERNKLAAVEQVPQLRTAPGTDKKYADRDTDNAKLSIPGTIFNTKLDLTHPLCFGFTREYMPVFKTGTSVIKKSGNAYGNPVVYTNSPLLSGYVSKENTDRIAGSSFASVFSNGRGSVITINDNVYFRAIWFGSSKIMVNGTFFGQLLRGSERYREE